MEAHQAGQQDTLIDINMEKERLDNNSTARASNADCRGCFKCVVALATLMGLVILGLVVFIILYGVTFVPKCKQNAGPPGSTTKINITKELEKTRESGRYDIFTADKAAKYIIYGWVKLPNPTSKESIVLEHSWNGGHVTIQKRMNSCTKVFFFAQVMLVSSSRLSLFFNDEKSIYTESRFHVYEL